MKIIISILIILLLSACAGKEWVNSQGTNAGVKRISSICLSHANTVAPQFFCADVLNCSMTENMKQISQINYHSQVYNACMYENGLSPL
jgi:hypothetical protein